MQDHYNHLTSAHRISIDQKLKMIRTEIRGHNAFLLLIIIDGELNFDSTFAGVGCSFYLSFMYF